MPCCMGKIQTVHGEMGCGAEAKFYEQSDYWHDWIWCENHAKGKVVEVLDESWNELHE